MALSGTAVLDATPQDVRVAHPRPVVAVAPAAVVVEPGQAPAPASKRPKVVALGGARLGVSIRDVEDEDVKSGRLSSPAGAVVEEVSEGSAAATGGLRKGDIIVEFDGERVRSARQFTRLVQETADGRKVPAVVLRDAQRVTLTLEPRQGGSIFELRDFADFGRKFSIDIPTPAVAPLRTMPWPMDGLFQGAGGRLGVTVDTLSPQLAEYFGTKDGVLVTSVESGSAASKAGVKAGDVITSLNGSAIDDPADLRRRIQQLKEGEEFSVAVVRDKKALTLKGKLEQPVRRRTYRTVI
jgi:serine protease Do